MLGLLIDLEIEPRQQKPPHFAVRETQALDAGRNLALAIDVPYASTRKATINALRDNLLGKHLITNNVNSNICPDNAPLEQR